MTELSPTAVCRPQILLFCAAVRANEMMQPCLLHLHAIS